MGQEDQESLNEKLAQAVRCNSTQKVIDALKAGADINHLYSSYEWTAIAHAGCKKYLEVIPILLEAGADINMADKDGDSFAKYMKDSDELKELYRQYLDENSVSKVTFRNNLSNRILEEIYDFERLERISLVRKAPYKKVESMFRESFSRIEDEASLKKAFNEHVKRGGKTHEGKVFPYTIIKSRPRLL